MHNHKGGGDVKAGYRREETPELRWRFICKVYAIVSLQLVATIPVFLVAVLVPQIHVFFMTTTVVRIVVIILPCIVLIPLCYFCQKYPVNLLLLGLFTITLAFSVGLSCPLPNLLEVVILTSVVLVSLTLYTFWAAKRGHDFQFLGPFLFGALMVLIVFGLIQIFFPMGRLTVMILGCLAPIIFYGYIIYDTNILSKCYNNDQYIWAAIALYQISLFLSLLIVVIASI